MYRSFRDDQRVGRGFPNIKFKSQPSTQTFYSPDFNSSKTSTLSFFSFVHSLSRLLSRSLGRSLAGGRCGPKNQIPSDPKDTCNTPPGIANGPAVFGMNPLPKDKHWRGFDWTICTPVMLSICDIMAQPDVALGRWYFSTSQVEVDYGSPACHMGFWLPADPASAPKPTDEQCKNIFQTLPAAANKEGIWDGATINVAVNPADGEGQWPMDGGSGTGQQVNGGYPSYVMQVQHNCRWNEGAWC